MPLNGLVELWVLSLQLRHEVFIALWIKTQNTMDVDVLVNNLEVELDVIPDVLCRRDVVVHPEVEDVRATGLFRNPTHDSAGALVAPPPRATGLR